LARSSEAWPPFSVLLRLYYDRHLTMPASLRAIRGIAHFDIGINTQSVEMQIRCEAARGAENETRVLRSVWLSGAVDQRDPAAVALQLPGGFQLAQSFRGPLTRASDLVSQHLDRERHRYPQP
jgi:hypothetical protein